MSKIVVSIQDSDSAINVAKTTALRPCSSSSFLSSTCPPLVAGSQSISNMTKPLIQPKLKIGATNDKYEQEADRVADQVMRMPEPGAVQTQNSPLQIQRVCPECEEKLQRQIKEEEEEELIQTKPIIQRQPEEEEEELIQTKAGAGQTPQLDPETASQIQGLRGRGQALDSSIRAFMEPRFGQDFSQVRVHADKRAADLARSINARAFTVGHDVVFGSGEYYSGGSSGKKLLAHELTHVVQQHGGPVSVRRKVDVDNFEVEEFDRRTLQSYLKTIAGGEIEDYNDSDDKARRIVKEWRRGKRKKLGAKTKTTLIREMQRGFTGDDDERAILALLLHSDDRDLKVIFAANGGIDPEALDSDFHTDEEDVLRAFYDRKFVGGREKALSGSRKLRSQRASRKRRQRASRKKKYKLDAMDKAVLSKLKQAMELSKENERENCGNVFATTEQNFRVTGPKVGKEPEPGKAPTCEANDSPVHGETWVAYYHSHIPTPNFVPYMKATDPNLVFSFEDKIAAQEKNIVYYLVNWKKVVFRYNPDPDLEKGQYTKFKRIHKF